MCTEAEVVWERLPSVYRGGSNSPSDNAVTWSKNNSEPKPISLPSGHFCRVSPPNKMEHWEMAVLDLDSDAQVQVPGHLPLARGADMLSLLESQALSEVRKWDNSSGCIRWNFVMERGSRSNVRCFSPVHKGSWQSENDYRDQESGAGEKWLIALPGFTAVGVLKDHTTHRGPSVPGLAPSVSNMSFLQLAWKLSPLRVLGRTFACP